MVLIKKNIKKGGSYSITIDKGLINLLGFDPDAPFELTVTNGKSLSISQGRNEISDEIAKNRLRAFKSKYGSLFDAFD